MLKPSKLSETFGVKNSKDSKIETVERIVKTDKTNRKDPLLPHLDLAPTKHVIS